MRYDYVVIGGGLSGMTAALLLAKHGRRTVLIEQAPRLAPLVRGFKRNGVYFDTGFHYAGGLGPGEPLSLFLHYLGLDQQLTTKPFDPDGFDRFRFADGMAVNLPVGHEPIVERLGALFPDERHAIAEYLRRLDTAANEFPYLNLDADFAVLNSLQFVHGPSLQDVLDELFCSPRLKELFAAHCVLHGSPASEIPFALHSCFVGPYYHSAHGLVGGGASLVAAFEMALEAAGVEVLTGRSVAAITADNEGLNGVQLEDGETIMANACVATVHPTVLVELVPDGFFRPAYKKRLKLLENSTSALLSYVACDQTPDWLLNSNLIVRDTVGATGASDGNNDLLFIAGAESIADPQRCGGLVVINPCSMELTAAWQDSRFGQRPAAYRQFKRDADERLLQRLNALPEFAGRLKSVELATPLTLRDYSNNPGGGLYGVKHKVGQYNPQPVTKLPGLLLAGQAVAGPGLFGTMLSSFLACGSVLGNEMLREDVKRCS